MIRLCCEGQKKILMRWRVENCDGLASPTHASQKRKDELPSFGVSYPESVNWLQTFSVASELVHSIGWSPALRCDAFWFFWPLSLLNGH